MNLNEYLKAEDELDSLYDSLEQSQSESEADGILRRIDILETRVSRYLDESPRTKTEEEEY